MSLQNPNTQRDVTSSAFIFEELVEAKTESPRVLVQKKQSDCQLIPFLTDFQFKPCCMPKDFQIFADEIRNFKIRKDDIWLLSWPKSGTTWLTNIVSQLHCFDFAANNYHITEGRNTFSLELTYMNRPGSVNCHSERMKYSQKIESAPSPRIIISHLPPQILPVELWIIQPKMIYIARNPKDAAVSLYYMSMNISKDESRSVCSKDEYFDEFLAENTTFGPYDMHVLSFWSLRHLDNFLFLMYEELLADPFQGMKTISEFLDCEYCNTDLEKLVSYLSFDNMKQTNEKVSTHLNYRARFVKKLCIFKEVYIL